jgi:gliding motility-associated-like protein
VNSSELEIGTDPLNADSDGDGLYDGEEALAFDNPNTFPIATVISDPLNPCDPDPTAVPEANCPIPVLDIEIPAGISPNGDGVGDALIITNVELFPNNNISIFNRWGNPVYEMTETSQTWDGSINGKDADEGVYYYQYEIEGSSGEKVKGQGYVQLIRN